MLTRPCCVLIWIKGMKVSYLKKREKAKEWGTCPPQWNQAKSNLLVQTMDQIKLLYQEWKTNSICRGAYAQQQQVEGILESPLSVTVQGAERAHWVPSLFPSLLEVKSSRSTMEELPRLSSTLAQGENTTGPKSNHHFSTNGNGRSKDSAERDNEGIFFYILIFV